MSSPGLSLFGFMDRPQALKHLKSVCVIDNPSEGALALQWKAARARLGEPIRDAGNPRIEPIPAKYQAYIKRLTTEPWVATLMKGPMKGCAFKMVEIDPLLAYQYTIDVARAGRICDKLGKPPSVEEMLNICLQRESLGENVLMSRQANSVAIKSRNLNLQILNQGMVGKNTIGITFGWSSPLVQVVVHKGKHYLHNGFHRAYGLRMAGAEMMPCVLRTVSDYDAIGVRDDGATFGPQYFENGNPPALGHYGQGRAYEVQLRAATRILNVSWSEHVMSDE
ncbi:MAG: hypothetical protein JO267_03365 [Alphaproteobacteria bacterium]|nr:hypothetical protein [Alphaproteobacteria bacterium]